MKSMTGFGDGEARGVSGRCTVQIQSVNSKYFKLNVNLEREIAFLEPKIRSYLQTRIGRGQVTAYVIFTPQEGGRERVVIDRSVCKDLATQFLKIRSWLKLNGGLDMQTLVNTGAVVRKEAVAVSRRPIWMLLRQGLSAACNDLKESQAREGRAITRDFLKQWRRVDALLNKIDARRPKSVRRYEERIRRKVRTMLEGAKYDESRLLAEVSIFADRVDITEEIVRLRSHLEHFRQLIAAGGEVGKKLDFIIQEIMREVNTSSNKANDASISRLAIEIKAEMEKIREQLQNVQ
ncbi:MAG: YicC family protein [Candidatus Aureabacteria bacterium]|nr:YicC family protein [Candidatus Auribacterota bacterium]